MHGSRSAYYIIDEGVLSEPDFVSGMVAPVTAPAPDAAAAALAPDAQLKVSPFKFGRLFPPRRGVDLSDAQRDEMVEALVELGLRMNNPEMFPGHQPPDPASLNSTIPAGYTYLGQFIAHEITFDDTDDLLSIEPDPANLRSPSLDLDSLYGDGPGGSKSIYQDGDLAKLKIGRTDGLFDGHPGFDSDLPRDQSNGFSALIGDRRNDENLAVAQTHVAFIKFHNKVVDKLREQGHTDPDIFECARIQVIRHFQWIILYDYLPTLVDQDIIDQAVGRIWERFDIRRPEELYMPLEFSAAAFRIGHTMVQGMYRWNNRHHSMEENSPGRAASLLKLFLRTALRGTFGSDGHGLEGDWVIDWRRFYKFQSEAYRLPDQESNLAGQIDTRFAMHIEGVVSFHGHHIEKRRSIPVRNLLRGFALGLPTGEEVVKFLKEEGLLQEEEVLTEAKLLDNEVHAAVLGQPPLQGNTPLWYYILKEAELKGDSKLGRVGGRIVAETLVGLIKNSRYSILKSPGWYPRYPERAESGTASAKFGMTDLLEFLGREHINPYP